MIDSLNTVRIATGAQLRELHWADTDTGKRLARHHLAKLTRLRLIARLERRVGGVRAGSDGYTYALDVAGHRIVLNGGMERRPRRPNTPGDRYLQHALATTQRYVELREIENANGCELIGFEAEPDSWRHYAGAHGRAQIIKPDAFVIVEDAEWEHRWFLEIDRDTEHHPTIIRKARDYITYWQSGVEQSTTDTFPKVLWVVPTEARASQLTDWLQTVGAEADDLFAVCTDATFKSFVMSNLSGGEVTS